VAAAHATAKAAMTTAPHATATAVTASPTTAGHAAPTTPAAATAAGKRVSGNADTSHRESGGKQHDSM
jgi:hypothetical protein